MRPQLAIVIASVLSGACAEAIRSDDDASLEADARATHPINGFDLEPLEPGAMPRLDASRPFPDGQPFPGTEPPEPDALRPPPSGPPTSPPSDPPDEPDAEPGPGTEPPPPPPPPPSDEPPECQTDEDCGNGQVCFGVHCVVDPSAPQIVGDGACTNQGDLQVLHGQVPFRQVSGDCTLACLQQMPPQPCIDTCVSSNTGFSPPCAACYGAYMTCTGTFCLIQCVFNDDDQEDCAECRDTFCDAALETCGGVAAPQMW